MIKDTLLNLLAIPGPTGSESACADWIEKEIAPYVDETRRDTMGNLICVKHGNGKGKGKKIMLSAHMDEIGFIVTGIEDEGFLRVMPLGGVRFDQVIACHVVLKSGAQGVVFFEGGHAPGTPLNAGRLFIDIGASSKEEAQQKAAIGDWAVVRPQVSDMGKRVASPYMDDRSGCAVLLETMKQVKNSDNEIYAVFSTQEEVGLRGARTAAYAIQPDMGIALDVTLSNDYPMNKKGVTPSKLGGGAAIKVMDSSVIAHPAVKSAMEEAAKKAGVPYQFEVLTGGGTDAGAIHLTGGGVPSGTLSVPCRYVHAPCEMVDISDLEACVGLLVALL